MKELNASSDQESANAPAQPANSQVAGEGRAEPRVFTCDDGRHTAALYQFEPPLSPEDVALSVDQLVGTGVDTLIYTPVLIGGSVLYDSAVAQKIGDNIEKWVHPVYYRTARNVQQLVADGHDPMRLLCDRAHRKGIWFLAAGWLTVTGGVREAFAWEGGNSDFALDHPEFQVGQDQDPRAAHVSPLRFSFLRREVREERLLLFEELLSRYETDGVALDLVQHAPLCRFDQVDALAPVLTQWIRELRGAAQVAEAAQGRRKRIYVQVPAHRETWKTVGLDVAGWVSEGLVDGLICHSGLPLRAIDQDIDLSWAKAATSGTDCRVLAAFGSSLARQFKATATAPMIWAAAANAYAQGADGFGLYGGGWHQSGWPWHAGAYGTLRPLAHPDLLDTADKLIRAVSTPEPPSAHGLTRYPSEGMESWTPGVGPALPRNLVEGRPVEIRLRISDDLQRRQSEGRVAAVRLRVRISHLEAKLNEVRVELNGRELPASLLHLKDLTYRQHRERVVIPYGYLYDYHLTPAYFPTPGHNLVTVTLVRRDPNIEPPFQVYDVDCVINYRSHRHFERDPIDY